MVNSGQLLTTYSTSHKTVIKVSTVVMLFFSIAYKHLSIISIRLSQQPPIHGLRGWLNCHFIWCIFKYVVILSCLRFLIASLISRHEIYNLIRNYLISVHCNHWCRRLWLTVDNYWLHTPLHIRLLLRFQQLLCYFSVLHISIFLLFQLDFPSSLLSMDLGDD